MTPPTAAVLPEELLRTHRDVRWTEFSPDMLPAGVAGTDMATAPVVLEAIERLVRDQDFGYPLRNGRPAGEALAAAFSRRMARLYGWQADAAAVVPVADLVQGVTATIMAFTAPGDSVAAHMPSYQPFRTATAATGRRFVPMPLRANGDRYELDLQQAREAFSSGVRLFILCNPHNPTGRVFTRAELQALVELAQEFDVVIVSDEIHSDLVLDGREHVPVAALGPEAAARTVTLTSATKSFNLPALRTAVMHFGSEALLRTFERHFPPRLLGQLSAMGIDATIAAWDHGDPWLDAFRLHLGQMRDRLHDRLAAEAPLVGFTPIEGTFMAWLDFGRHLPEGGAGAFLQEQAKVGAYGGDIFGEDYSRHARLVFGTSRELLDAMIDRIVAALRRNAR